MRNSDPFQRFGFKAVKISPWQIILVSAVVLAIGVALAVVATGIFLVVFPALLLVGAAYRLFGSRSRVTETPKRDGSVRVIDADYVVVDPGKPDNHRP